MNIIDQILSQTEISDSLENYKYVEFDELNTIPLGSHVKFIDRNENVKSGGFLIKFSEKPDRTKTYIILKTNLMYKLYPYYYWIFYKKPTHEPSLIKTIKKSNIGYLLEPTTQPAPSEDSTVMNIVIKSKTKPKAEPETKPKVKPKTEPDTNPEADKKVKSKVKSTKRDVFKALLESLDNSKK